MNLPIDETLAVVRDHSSPSIAWSEFVALCRTACPTAPWNSLPSLDFERDIVAAKVWLSTELAAFPDATTIYLCLDTLNMRQGDGFNVTFAIPRDAGGEHLIYGLYELLRVYEADAWREAFSLCDYIFFLGYSGIIFAQACERLSSPRTLSVEWGFHDGDIFPLGRTQDGVFTRDCH